MNSTDLQILNQFLVIILLIVIIIAIVVLVIQINKTLKTLNFILQDTENITEKVSYLSDHPEKIQEITERYVNESIDNVITTQLYKARSTFANQVLGSLVNRLRRD